MKLLLLWALLPAFAEVSHPTFTIVGVNPVKKELLLMREESGISYLVYDISATKGQGKKAISLGTQERPEKLGYVRAKKLSTDYAMTEDGTVLNAPNGMTLRFPPESIGKNNVPEPDTRFSVKVKKGAAAYSTVAKGLAHSGETPNDSLQLYEAPGYLLLLSTHNDEAEIVRIPN